MCVYVCVAHQLSIGAQIGYIAIVGGIDGWRAPSQHLLTAGGSRNTVANVGRSAGAHVVVH